MFLTFISSITHQDKFYPINCPTIYSRLRNKNSFFIYLFIFLLFFFFFFRLQKHKDP